jgi:hypothetical protein
VDQENSKMLTKINQWLSLKGCIIISDDSIQTVKPCHNIFDKTNDDFVRRAPRGDGFYPLG